MIQPIYVLIFAVVALVVLLLFKSKFNKYYPQLKEIIKKIDEKYFNIHNQSAEKMADAIDEVLDKFKFWNKIPDFISRTVLRIVIEIALRRYKKEIGNSNG